MSTHAAVLPRRWTWVPKGQSTVGLVLSGLLIGTLVVVAVAAPLLAPHDPNAIDLTNALSGTGPAHWLGTDALGRDNLSRLIFGARPSLLGPSIVVLGSTAIGVPLSLVATYAGGPVDSVVARVWDAMFGFPTLLLAIAVVATFGPGFWTATIAVMSIYVPLIARVTRGAVLVEREQPYVEACRVQGYTQARTVFAHVFPNIAPVVGAQAVLNFGYSLLDLAGLTFLGFGVQPPTADWGEMLTDGRASLLQHAYLEVAAASLAIVITVLAFNSFGYALAERASGRR